MPPPDIEIGRKIAKKLVKTLFSDIFISLTEPNCYKLLES